MEKKRRDDHENYEETGIFDRLPVELRLEILYFVHVQTLLVLRAVNKWFRSVIDDPSFASRHLRRLPSNLQETRFLTGEPGMEWKFECSVDGLVLLVHDTPDGSDYAVVWNPSFKTTEPHCRYLMRMGAFKHYALGYDASSNDYKVIVTNRCQAWVYSVGSKTYSDVTSHSGYRPKLIECVCCSRSLCFKDGVVWIEQDKRFSNSLKFVWFDFATENFRYTYTNEMPYDGKSRTGLMMLDGGSTVGLWGVDAVDRAAVASVWALQTDDMSWAPRYKIPQEMVPSGEGVDILKVAERDGEVVCKYSTREGPDSSVEVLSYRIRTQAIKRLGKILVRGGVCVGVLIESLFKL